MARFLASPEGVWVGSALLGCGSRRTCRYSDARKPTSAVTVTLKMSWRGSGVTLASNQAFPGAECVGGLRLGFAAYSKVFLRQVAHLGCHDDIDDGPVNARVLRLGGVILACVREHSRPISVRCSCGVLRPSNLIVLSTDVCGSPWRQPWQTYGGPTDSPTAKKLTR